MRGAEEHRHRNNNMSHLIICCWWCIMASVMLLPSSISSFIFIAPTNIRIIPEQTIRSIIQPTNNGRISHHEHHRTKPSTLPLQMAYGKYGNGRSSSRYAGDRTKRQERVGHVVRTELATVLHQGTIKNDVDPIEAELRRKINIVHADVSPDLRQARITISVMSSPNDRKSDTISKRRAYAWLVRNTKAIRYTLAQRMAHMKGGSPDLTFAQVDVGAAVDVMQLIDKLRNEGYKRDDVLEYEDIDDEWDGEDGDGDGDDEWLDFDDDGDGISVEVEV